MKKTSDFRNDWNFSDLDKTQRSILKKGKGAIMVSTWGRMTSIHLLTTTTGTCPFHNGKKKKKAQRN